MHRVEVAANNALDLRGAVFDAIYVARGDAALGGSGCWLGGRHSTTWLSALEVEVDRSSRSILGTYSMLTSSHGRRFNLKKSSLCHVSGGFEMG